MKKTVSYFHFFLERSESMFFSMPSLFLSKHSDRASSVPGWSLLCRKVTSALDEDPSSPYTRARTSLLAPKSRTQETKELRLCTYFFLDRSDFKVENHVPQLGQKLTNKGTKLFLPPCAESISS